MGTHANDDEESEDEKREKKITLELPKEKQRGEEKEPSTSEDPFNGVFLVDGNPCCDEPNIRDEDGFFVCRNCGLVFDQVLDSSPRRTFTREEIRKRKSNEPVYSPIGPRTVIRGRSDAKGTLLTAQGRSKFHRLAKIHRSLTTSYERNLWIALPNLQRLQEKLGLPEAVVEDALRIYTRSVKKKLTMGRSIDTLLAASIFVSLRIHNIPRTIEEILEVVELPKKMVVKAYRLILLKILPELKLKVTHFGAVRYVDKFVEDLNFGMRVRNLAVRILKKAKENGLSVEGKDPKGLAAAAIYLAAHKLQVPATQGGVAKVARVTEVTLRMRAKDIRKYIHSRDLEPEK
ncbi:MAG: transcription initiation factor IIB [Promethearchaeota archaeon]